MTSKFPLQLAVFVLLTNMPGLGSHLCNGKRNIASKLILQISVEFVNQ